MNISGKGAAHFRLSGRHRCIGRRRLRLGLHYLHLAHNFVGQPDVIRGNHGDVFASGEG